MDIRFDNKVVMVTGGSRGIGLGCAKLFAACGAKVAVVGRTKETADKGAEAVAEKGIAKGYALDVTDLSAIGQVVGQIRKDLGEIDVFVSSAGVEQGGPMLAETMPEEAWDYCHDINAKGMFFCARDVAQQSMIPRKSGSIITIGSQFSIVGMAMCIPYCTSKATVSQITRALALEWSKYNIRVNCVAPTWTKTDMADSVFETRPEFLKNELTRIPLGRLAEVEEVAPAVCFLAHDYASMITGVTLPVDGGYTAQ